MAKRRLPDLADDHRCTRNGTNWRCHLPRLAGKSYCQKHHQFNVARSRARSKSNNSQNPVAICPHNPSLLREIWAFYDSPGGLPRLYARVESRIPHQSQVVVTPLVPAAGGGAACGIFRALDATEVMGMSRFSHRVWFEIEGGGEEVYKIFPRRGEIWAVERYNWIEMTSSFGDPAGASGIVLVEADEEGEGGGCFRRRLHEECELIRRFSMVELGMFLYRVSDARVLECGRSGEGLLLQGCTALIEVENERQERICHQPETLEECYNIEKENNTEGQAPDHQPEAPEECYNIEKENNTEGQAPDHQPEAPEECYNIEKENNTEGQATDLINNDKENAQSLGNITSMENVGAAVLTSGVAVEANHQQPESCCINTHPAS